MNEWISVKDRLPEKNVDVLCYDQGNMVVTSFSGEFLQKTKPIWNDPTGYYSPMGDVDAYTHWMPLPPKP